MTELTFTIKCDEEIIASNVRAFNVGMIVEALIDRYYNAAALGQLKITISAEKNVTDDDELLPF